MLTNLTYWISSLHPDELFLLVAALLLIDTPRYVAGKVLICLWDMGADLVRWLRGRSARPAFTHCPSVCVVLADYNGADSIEAVLTSVWGSYPRLEIIVIDDGSRPGAGDVARAFARTHPGILCLSRRDRGGKSSCINYALRYTRSEVVVVLDNDTQLERHALWEVVQPFADPRVGAVSAALLVRDPFKNFLTCMQAYEYLSAIFVGRIVLARLGILGIVSGGFGAFRRAAIDRVGEWDVGPGEDGDITLRIRKAGYRIAYAPYAQAFTAVPTTWWGWWKQRRRWNRGVVRYKCRKHIDMAYFWSPGFQWGNFFLLANVWVFTIFCLYAFWAFVLWTLFHFRPHTTELTAAALLGYLLLHVLQVPTLLFYSTERWRDLAICLILPFYPLYHLADKVVRLVSVTEELFLRGSYHDDYVPARVREATWHW